jgi:hypothetical protein
MTGQNRSSAVMQQRIEADDSLDDFPTQPWGTRALVEHVIMPMLLPVGPVWEPACNRGFMARPLAEYFNRVLATDVHHYGWSGQQRVEDFLFPSLVAEMNIEWVITNPPFRLAEQFIAKARDVARVGCAMLVRTSFLEGVGRYQRLFSVNPPTITAQFVERLPMVKGRVDRKASTATSYAWLVWVRGVERQPFQWIPPCRARLERDSDYLPAAVPA